MQNHEIEVIGKYAASLSVVEIGLGSILHAASIPLTGQILSINQTAFLARASFKENSKTISLKISLVTSILKSLAPAGKKLTPMLAILAQGFLFSAGLTFFGVNYFGLIISIFLSSLWAFIQPLLIIYFLFGKTILNVLDYFKKEFTLLTTLNPLMFLKLLVLAYLIKVVIASIISIKITKMNDDDFAKLQIRLSVNVSKTKKNNSENHLVNAFYDLLQPVFIISFLLTSIFLYYSQSSKVIIIWTLLRPISIGLLLFYIVRIYPMEKVIIFLEKKGMTKFSRSLQIAIDSINKNREL
jgi:hypothetical protein